MAKDKRGAQQTTCSVVYEGGMNEAFTVMNEWMNEGMKERTNERMIVLLTCDKKLTKSSLVLHTRQPKEDNGRTKT